nr:hypothetical protein [uncultured Roseateles sp.]
MKKTLPLALILLLSSHFASADGVARSDWTRLYATVTPKLFCAEGAPIRTCFALSAEQCERSATVAINSCLVKLESDIPLVIQTKEESVLVGGKIGGCAGRDVGEKHQASFSPEACKSALRDIPGAPAIFK